MLFRQCCGPADGGQCRPGISSVTGLSSAIKQRMYKALAGEKCPRCAQKKRAPAWRAFAVDAGIGCPHDDHWSDKSQTPRPYVDARRKLPSVGMYRSLTSTVGRPAPNWLQLAPPSVVR